MGWTSKPMVLIDLNDSSFAELHCLQKLADREHATRKDHSSGYQSKFGDAGCCK